MKYIRTEHFILDFRKNTRDYVGTFYATQEVVLAEKKILFVSPANGKMPNATVELEGQDLLSFKTYLAGNHSPVSTGRFLNSDYQEMIFAADLPDKGISIAGNTSKISDTLFVATKTIKIHSTGEIGAIAQEIVYIISKDEFDKEVSTLG